MCAKRKKKKQLDHFLTPYTRINSKGIKDLNVKLKTMKIPEDNIGWKVSQVAVFFFLIYHLGQRKQKKNKPQKTNKKTKKTLTGLLVKMKA